MLYFDMLDPIRVLTDAERGKLLVAMLEYGQIGKLPQFKGKLALAWSFVQMKIDRDEEEYNRSVLRRKYATACRERKRKGLPEITFDEWVMINDDQCYPTTTATTTTTTTSTTAAAATATATATVIVPDDDLDEDELAEAAEAAEQKKLKILGGTLGKDVLLISDEQIGDLLDQMGLEAFDYYTDKLSTFILEKGAKVASHYETILKWWRKDSRVEKR